MQKTNQHKTKPKTHKKRKTAQREHLGGVDPINVFNAVSNSMSYVPRHETI